MQPVTRCDPLTQEEAWLRARAIELILAHIDVTAQRRQGHTSRGAEERHRGRGVGVVKGNKEGFMKYVSHLGWGGGFCRIFTML